MESFAVILGLDPHLKLASKFCIKPKRIGEKDLLSTKIQNIKKLTNPAREPCRGTEIGDGISREMTSTNAMSDRAKTPRAWAADSLTAGVRAAEQATASTEAAPPLYAKF